MVEFFDNNVFLSKKSQEKIDDGYENIFHLYSPLRAKMNSSNFSFFINLGLSTSYIDLASFLT